MKKLREMKKNNKGFSLVELIVVIAIMVVLVAVLGSTILGYIDESKYSKDISALDAVDTAVGLMVADPDSEWTNGATTKLDVLMKEPANKALRNALQEVFTETSTGVWDFVNSSPAFDDLGAEDIKVKIENGAVRIYAPTKSGSGFNAYESPKGVGDFS